MGLAVQISGCATDSYAAKGAGKGATTGALAGAVGGMATALIFGGDVGDAESRTGTTLLQLGEIRAEYGLPKDC